MKCDRKGKWEENVNRYNNKAKRIIDKLKVNIVCSGATTKNNKT